MKYLIIIAKLILFVVLTVLTQTGGVVYLLSIVSSKKLNKHFTYKWFQRASGLMSFIVLYALFTFVITPIIASFTGRVALPMSETNHVRPLNMFTYLFNRHYVKIELREAIFDVAQQLNKQYPGTTIKYLDANFPFIDHFPLFPHLSHNDGEKLDLSFFYLDAKTQLPIDNGPSFIGYGVCEEPLVGEVDMPAQCEARGFWQYSLLQKIVSQSNKQNFIFDKEKTGTLLKCLCLNPVIGKVFIEPHLKQRLQIASDKVRFHGCRAVRHDDHIHVQLK